jgi:hypothetical protein
MAFVAEEVCVQSAARQCECLSTRVCCAVCCSEGVHTTFQVTKGRRIQDRCIIEYEKSTNRQASVQLQTRCERATIRPHGMPVASVEVHVARSSHRMGNRRTVLATGALCWQQAVHCHGPSRPHRALHRWLVLTGYMCAMIHLAGRA